MPTSNGYMCDKFGSIPDTMGVATLDDWVRGYAGKVFSSIIDVLRLGLFIIPTSILASGFNKQLRAQVKKQETATKG